MTRPTRDTVAGRTYLDLQNLARHSQRNTNELLTFYALEGFLARLSISPYLDQCVLKGGMLLAAIDTRRPTRDIDLHATQLPNDTDSVLEVVRHILAIDLDDGLEFSPENARAETIREGSAYTGYPCACTPCCT
ncbi:MAG: nucleotidyl transferase AbiEii/AbiGii toxin family protein, partial [Mycobacteriales bacterium]